MLFAVEIVMYSGVGLIEYRNTNEVILNTAHSAFAFFFQPISVGVYFSFFSPFLIDTYSCSLSHVVCDDVYYIYGIWCLNF